MSVSFVQGVLAFHLDQRHYKHGLRMIDRILVQEIG